VTTPGHPLRIQPLRDIDQDGVAARQAGLTPGARQLHREVLRAFLATGRAPHRAELPGAGGTDQEEAFRQLVEVDLVQLDAVGRVAMAYPFSGQPTGHTVQIDDGPVLDTMCAIDALGIPLMTGESAVIVSTDPSDEHPIRVERRGEVWRWAPAGTVVLLAQTGGGGPAAECLCPAITFHADRAGAEEWLRRRPELTGVVLDQDQAIDVADRSFGSLLAPDREQGAGR